MAHDEERHDREEEPANQEEEPLLEEQEGKGYGSDPGAREQALDEEVGSESD